MKNILTKKPYKNALYTLLCVVIEFQLKYEMFDNRNNLKKGDKVKYNWKAKAYIGSAIEHKQQTKIVDYYLYKDNSNVQFLDGDSCDPFWVSKV